MTDNKSTLNILDKNADVYLKVVPVALAGGGGVTQATQIDEWLSILNGLHDIPVRRVGVSSPRAGYMSK